MTNSVSRYLTRELLWWCFRLNGGITFAMTEPRRCRSQIERSEYNGNAIRLVRYQFCPLRGFVSIALLSGDIVLKPCFRRN